MADSKKCIQSYRIVWKIFEHKILNDSFRTCNFVMGNTKCYIEIQRKSLRDNIRYTIFLKCEKSFKTDLVESSYYLLTDDGNQKFENVSKYETDPFWFETNTSEKIVVCAFEVAADCVGNAIHWLEAKSEELKISAFFKPILTESQSKNQHYLIDFVNDSIQTTCYIKLSDIEPGSRKPAMKSHITGLHRDQYLLVAWFDPDNEDQDVTLLLGPNDKCVQHITSVNGSSMQVLCKTCDFKKMNDASISEIEEKIRNSFSDYLMGENFDKSQKVESAKIINEINSGAAKNSAITTAAITEQIVSTMLTSFTDNKFCDITVQVPGGAHIRAHKIALVSGSTVWRKLLTNDEQVSIISVPDLEKETIETLIHFIYFGSVTKPPKHIDQLLIAADTYGVDALKTWCEQQLMTSITIDSAVSLLVLSQRYNALVLFERVLEFVRINNAELKTRDEWKSAIFSHPDLAFQLLNTIL